MRPESLMRVVEARSPPIGETTVDRLGFTNWLIASMSPRSGEWPARTRRGTTRMLCLTAEGYHDAEAVDQPLFDRGNLLCTAWPVLPLKCCRESAMVESMKSQEVRKGAQKSGGSCLNFVGYIEGYSYSETGINCLYSEFMSPTSGANSFTSNIYEIAAVRSWASALLPLNRSWRFRRNVVNDAVDAAHLAYDPARN
jgi:hypothetical protein